MQSPQSPTPHLRHLLSVASSGFQVPLAQALHSVAPWPSTLMVIWPAGHFWQLSLLAVAEKKPAMARGRWHVVR